MLYKSKLLTLETIVYSWYVDEYISLGPRGRFHSYICHIGLFGTGGSWVELHIQRRLCPIFVKEIGSPDIHKCFHRLTGSQRTPRIWGVTVRDISDVFSNF